MYQPSPRPFTTRLDPITYPGLFELRRVSGDNTLHWNSPKVFVSSLLKGNYVGLEPIADGIRAVYFRLVHLGWLDEADHRIMDVLDRARRRR